MTADVIQFERPMPALRVELTSPGVLSDGARGYHINYVERDGRHTLLWSGTDYDEARAEAVDCGGDGVPVLDLTRASPVEIPTGSLH